MHHLIIGYGYCGFHLAAQLLRQNMHVTAVSRTLAADYALDNLNHLPLDITQPFHWQTPDTILYYLIPPPADGDKDRLLHQFLQQSQLNIKKVIYFGSSGVYGEQHGQWVNEQSTCHMTHDRQRRRLHAEHLWQQTSSAVVLMRIGGIYGQNRLPVQAAHQQSPLLKGDEAPWMNHIYVQDLVNIALQLALSPAVGIYNVADGNPQKMGSLQRLTAEQLHLPQAPQHDWQSIWNKASPMKREFMQANKRLSIEKLKQTLGDKLFITPLQNAVKHSLQGIIQ